MPEPMEPVQPVEVEADPLFGFLDVVILIALGAFGVWWMLSNKKKREEQAAAHKSYSLQPTSLMAAPTDNSFLKKLKASGRSLVAFYGSQTGTAEEFAGRLAKEGIRYGLKGMVADPEEYEMEELVNLKDIPNSLAVFCLATYGEGDPTDNAMEFYEWLQNGDANLTGLNYAVFGLGNKTYEHYNEVAKYVDKRLEELGASRVYIMGLGDDDANIEDDFITWKEGFWPSVCEYFGIETMGEDVSVRQYRLTEHTEIDPGRLYTGEVARLHSFVNQRPPFDAKNPFLANIKVNRELYKSSVRQCMHLEFDIEGSKMRYDAGDHLALYPVNNSELVVKLGKLLDADLDMAITLTNTDGDQQKHPFPCPTTYRTALTHYLDITSNPRTHVLKELAEYTKNNKEQEMLRLMASTSPEGKQLYQQWINQDNRNIVQILEDLPSCKPEIDHVCELLPRLQCRYYSISSSPKLYPTTVHVTAVVVEYETPTKRINKGVATTWLRDLKPVDPEKKLLCPVFVRKSQFRLPTRTQTPIIMIGPGTGLAPFRGFIQERALAKEEGKPVGETILYFGCRKKAEDFLYEEELADFVNKGVLQINLKMYVTHKLQENAEEIWRVLGENNGHIYVCGDARSMAKDVHDIILKVIQEKGSMSQQEAVAYVKKMEAQKRYSTDCWS